jgi:hypothetical protein
VVRLPHSAGSHDNPPAQRTPGVSPNGEAKRGSGLRIADRVRAARRLKLPHAQKVVFVSLVELSRDDGTLYRDPTVSELALGNGQGESTVRRALKGLEADGWIARTRKPRKAGSGPYKKWSGPYRHRVNLACLGFKVPLAPSGTEAVTAPGANPQVPLAPSGTNPQVPLAPSARSTGLEQGKNHHHTRVRAREAVPPDAPVVVVDSPSAVQEQKQAEDGNRQHASSTASALHASKSGKEDEKQVEHANGSQEGSNAREDAKLVADWLAAKRPELKAMPSALRAIAHESLPLLASGWESWLIVDECKGIVEPDVYNPAGWARTELRKLVALGPDEGPRLLAERDAKAMAEREANARSVGKALADTVTDRDAVVREFAEKTAHETDPAVADRLRLVALEAWEAAVREIAAREAKRQEDRARLDEMRQEWDAASATSAADRVESDTPPESEQPAAGQYATAEDWEWWAERKAQRERERMAS